VRVLLVDDDDFFRAGLAAMLSARHFDVIDADGGAAAVRRVSAQRPDVVLMDLNMPGMSGVEATRELQRIAPGLPVVMLTAATDDAQVVEAVRAGASGYLLKGSALDDVVAGIHGAVTGHAMIAPRVAGGLLAAVRSGQTDEDPRPRTAVELTDRERDVLALLVTGADNGDIARQLFLSISTVKTHVSSVIEKLGVENRVQAAVLAVRDGLVD
jgi:DNA-binding NarL/FixJ family response regulator